MIDPSPPPASYPPRHWSTVVSRVLMATYAVLLAVVLFSPTSGVQSRLVGWATSRAVAAGIPDTLATVARMEVLANVALVVPISFLGVLSFPRSRWEQWTAWGFLGALSVEVLQAVFLPGRQGAYSDVVANAAGALVGGLLGALALRLGRRD